MAPRCATRSCPTPAWASNGSAGSSSALIVGADYGTRCSTVLAIGTDGSPRFEERTRAPDGSVTLTTVNGEALRERATASAR